MVWWIAPDYPLSMVAWRILKMLAWQFGGLAEVRESEKRIEFASGGFLEVKGAHTDASLRSATLDLVIMDEAAFTKEERWTKELRATLAIRKGEALFLSTFDGENWFYELYQRGQSQDNPEWMSWRHKSIENPYFDKEELEEARRTTPKAEFEQEYEANPLVYVGAVFDGEQVQAAADRGYAVSHRADLPTYAGLDWGYTGLTALEICQEDKEGRAMWLEEYTWTATELNERCQAITATCQRLGIQTIYADAAGATENRTLAETLKRTGLKTQLVPVPFGKFKDTGISTRRWYLENGLESLSPKCPKLIHDSKRYRYKEDSEDVVKRDDHTVDACTAFYSSRARRMIRAGA